MVSNRHVVAPIVSDDRTFEDGHHLKQPTAYSKPTVLPFLNKEHRFLQFTRILRGRRTDGWWVTFIAPNEAHKYFLIRKAVTEKHSFFWRVEISSNSLDPARSYGAKAHRRPNNTFVLSRWWTPRCMPRTCFLVVWCNWSLKVLLLIIWTTKLGSTWKSLMLQIIGSWQRERTTRTFIISKESPEPEGKVAWKFLFENSDFTLIFFF